MTNSKKSPFEIVLETLDSVNENVQNMICNCRDDLEQIKTMIETIKELKGKRPPPE